MRNIAILSKGQYQMVSVDELINILTSEHDDLAIIFGYEHLTDEQKNQINNKKID